VQTNQWREIADLNCFIQQTEIQGDRTEQCTLASRTGRVKSTVGHAGFLTKQLILKAPLPPFLYST
jgi:hypothetical protein